MSTTQFAAPRKVFVTQENPMLNYQPAEEFGDLAFLTRDDLSVVKNSLHNVEVITQLRAKLNAFNPLTDFIVVSGSPSVTAAVFLILGEKHTKIQLLRWSNRDRVYQPVTLDTTPQV